MKNIIKLLFSVCACEIVYLFGGYDISLKCLIISLSLDYITGVSKSFINGNLSSKTGYKGMIKKFNILCLVVLSVQMDRMTGTNGILRTTIIYYITSNEMLSIIENLSAMNILVPDILKNKLIQVKENEKND